MYNIGHMYAQVLSQNMIVRLLSMDIYTMRYTILLLAMKAYIPSDYSTF